MNLSLHLTFKKYNEIDCLQFEIYLYGFFGFKSMIKCFVYISKVWWNSLFTFDKYIASLCLHLTSLFTLQKYDEIICLLLISKMQAFVYIKIVWWNKSNFSQKSRVKAQDLLCQL